MRGGYAHLLNASSLFILSTPLLVAQLTFSFYEKRGGDNEPKEGETGAARQTIDPETIAPSQICAWARARRSRDRKEQGANARETATTFILTLLCIVLPFIACSALAAVA